MSPEVGETRVAFGLTTIGADPDTPVRNLAAKTPAGAKPLLPGRFEVVGLLGAGGMGEVWEVEDRALGRRVALKILHARVEERGQERFFQEARTCARLVHPNILPAYSAGVALDGRVLFTMMKVVGRTLKDAMAKESLEKCVKALGAAARGVAHAHAQGVLHRDVKPTNILLGEHGEVWVVDWGVARIRRDETAERPRSIPGGDVGLTATGALMGTLAYMAPEQADGDQSKVGPWSDIYALGAVLYEILTGHYPHEGTEFEVLRKLAKAEVEPPSERAPDRSIAPELEAVAMKALARDRRSRHRSAGEFADDLDAFLAGRAVSAYREPVALGAARSLRRHPVAWAAVALALFASLLGVGMAWGARRIEESTAGARERAESREREERTGQARRGLAVALEDASAAYVEWKGALESYAEPFEHVYSENLDRPNEAQWFEWLETHDFQPELDPWVDGASEAWRSATAEARAHLEVAPDGDASREILEQELAWTLKAARLEERSRSSVATVAADRATDSARWKRAKQLAGELGVRPEILEPVGRVGAPRVPEGATVTLVEYVPDRETEGKTLKPSEVEWRPELPIGSYAAIVTREGIEFVFPFFLERRDSVEVDLALPRKLPEGYLWVPAGVFLAGGEGMDAWPHHRRRLERGFAILRTEVAPEGYGSALTRAQAEALAASEGASLPTEVEWERAARGADGRTFVWGDGYDASFANLEAQARAEAAMHPRDTSVFGTVDMAGSACEWISTLGDLDIVRGSCWAWGEREARGSSRGLWVPSGSAYPQIGFRTVLRLRE